MEFFEKNYKKLIIIIFVLGILFRSIYVIKSPLKENQYDCKILKLETLEDYEDAYKMEEKNIGTGGHLFYIMILHNTFKLPNSSGGQYYHPPLHHFICAIFLKFLDLFPLNAMQKLESLQILSLVYSIVTLLFIYKIIEKLEINSLGKCIIMLILSCFPMFIYMAGFINNDTLVTMFSVICFYYIIKWNEDPSMKNTLIFSFIFGLGMMTKVSIAIMGVPTAIVVIKKLVESIKQKDTNLKKKIIIETILFIVIAGSLGLWFQIRNTIVNKHEFMTIQKPYDHFYSGDAGPLERWGIVSKELLVNEIKTSDKNIFTCILNSSLYCLREEVQAGAIGTYFLVFEYLLKELMIFLGAISIYELIKEVGMNKNSENKIILQLIFATWLVGFIAFNVRMPYSCTMNARYIGILFITQAIYLGINVSKSKDKKWIILISVLTILFSILSAYVALR